MSKKVRKVTIGTGYLMLGSCSPTFISLGFREGKWHKILLRPEVKRIFYCSHGAEPEGKCGCSKWNVVLEQVYDKKSK